MEVAIRTPGVTPARGAARLSRSRFRLRDGRATTLHVAHFDRRRIRARVIRFPRPRPVLEWCWEAAVRHAIVGGFFVRPGGRPLGELRLDGDPHDHEPFASPWRDHRACVLVQGGEVALAGRPEVPPAPDGDLLQAGPLLVRGGCSLMDGVLDPEGFSAGSHQFDSDITIGRYPRAALGLTEHELLAVACDGRAPDEAGLTLAELAEAMSLLGSRTAINLDGGGSTSLIFDGELRNTPREEHGAVIPGGRPVATALAFEPVPPR